MVSPRKPPLPPNRPYRWPFNYPKYVKDVHVKVFKAANRTNNETNDAKIINLFNFTLRDIVSD
jgi:hypothetical protein